MLRVNPGSRFIRWRSGFRRGILGVALAGALGAGSAFVWREIAPPSGTTDLFWGRIALLGVWERESYPTLRELALKADGVVLGHLTGYETGRTFVGDTPDDQVTLGVLKVEVSTTIRGKVSERILVEILLPAPSRLAAVEQETELRQHLPTSPVLVFLRRSDRPGFFTTVNSDGLWVETERGGPLDTPLSEEPPRISRRFSSELQAVGDVIDLATKLRAIPAP